jgi:hypothetical protein
VRLPLCDDSQAKAPARHFKWIGQMKYPAAMIPSDLSKKRSCRHKFAGINLLA